MLASMLQNNSCLTSPSSSPKLTTTPSVESPAKQDEISAASKTSSVSNSSTEEVDDDLCCDCGMDCGFGGCTAFDGVS